MIIRVSKSITTGTTTVSSAVEVSNLDLLIDSSQGSLCFEFVEMLIDKVFSDSDDFEIVVTDSEKIAE